MTLKRCVDLCTYLYLCIGCPQQIVLDEAFAILNRGRAMLLLQYSVQLLFGAKNGNRRTAALLYLYLFLDKAIAAERAPD